MARRLWNIAEYDKKKAVRIAEECDADEFAVLLLTSRGAENAEDVREYLFGRTELSDPFLLKDMDKAVQRISLAVENGEKITVYGDYDADGVTATALLYSYLEAMGADVSYYIPSRMLEGYGLSFDTAQKLIDDGTQLVITVDNGINAVDEIKYLASHGVDIIVTDHHRPGEVLPEACAVVDPYRADDESPFGELAGVGVALKLAAALDGGDYISVMQDYADIVAVGTIADIVPLRGENRTMVLEGLEAINAGTRCGIQALREISGGADREINSTGVAFTIAPRINAAGRMDEAEIALKLLLSEDPQEASELAHAIDESNIARQEAEILIIRDVSALLTSNPKMRFDRVLVVDGENWHAGVIGIVASRLVEKYGKPAIVISRDVKTGIAKGSGRSVDGFSLFEALSHCSENLLQFGGHTLAAGFSINNNEIDLFRNRINTYASGIEGIFPTLIIDCRLNPSNINQGILNSLHELEPFGAANPVPMFGLMHMTVKGVKSLANNKHLRVTLARDETTVSCVKFGTAAEKFPFREGDVIDAAVKLDKNNYFGETRVSIQIKDMRPAGSDDVQLFRSMALYEKICRGEETDVSEKALACPSREIIASVFKFIKENGGWSFGAEILCFRLGLPADAFCRVCVAVDALTERGILKNENGNYRLCEVARKTDLRECPLLSELGYTE